MRVATFVVRYEVAKTPTKASNFQALLIASGVLLVAGFLFLAEAVLMLLYEWLVNEIRVCSSTRSCIVRGRDFGRFTKFLGPLRHLVLVVFSVIGVIGAVLQIVAINKLDFDLFDTAKSLRIASGALFIFISSWVIVAPIGLVVLHWNRLPCSTSNVLLATTIVVLCGCSLMLESVYRVLAATKIDGFILETYSVGVLLVLPESIVIVAFATFDLDNLSRITLYHLTKASEEKASMSVSKKASEV